MIFRKGGLQVENLEELIKWIVDQEWGNGLIDALFPDVNLKERKLFLREYPHGHFYGKSMSISSPRGQNYLEIFALDADEASYLLAVESGDDTDITGRELLRPDSYIRDYMRGAVWYPDGESFDEIWSFSEEKKKLKSKPVENPDYKGGLIICLEKSRLELPSGFRAIDLSEAIDLILSFCRKAPDERLRSYLIFELSNIKITYEHGIEVISRDWNNETLASGHWLFKTAKNNLSRELRGQPGAGSSPVYENIFKARIIEGLYLLFRQICDPVISSIPSGEKTAVSDSSYWYPLLRLTGRPVIFQLFHVVSTNREESLDDYEDEDSIATVVYRGDNHWAYNYDICLGITLDILDQKMSAPQGCIYINDARIEKDRDRDRLLTLDIEKLGEKGIFRPLPIRSISLFEPRVGKRSYRYWDYEGLGLMDTLYTGLSEVSKDATFTVSELYSFFSEMMQRMVDIVLSDPDGDFFSESGK